MSRLVTQPSFTVDILDYRVTLKELTQQEWEELMQKLGNQDNTETKGFLARLASMVRDNKVAVLPYILKIDRLVCSSDSSNLIVIERSVEKIINQMPRSDAKQVLDKVTEQLIWSEDQRKNSSSSLAQPTAVSTGSAVTAVNSENVSASTSQE